MLGRTAPLKFREMGIEPDAIVPPADTTYEVPRSLCFDGLKARSECADQQWSGKDKAYVLEPYVVVFDGTVGKHFYPKGSSYTPWPQGIIRNRFPEANALYLLPLFMTFRAVSPEYRSFDLQTMAASGRRNFVQNRPSYEWERHTAGSREQMWVDPSRACTIVGYQSMTGEQITSKIRMEYREEGECGFVPVRWNIVTFFPDGKLQGSVEATLTDCQINTEVAAGEFELEFPPGTRVTDTREGDRSLGYIVRASGGKRKVLPADIGATYDQMLNSDPGEALGTRRPAWASWPFLLACFTALLAGGLLIWRRWPLKLRFLRG
jgi:hypothetical protein